MARASFKSVERSIEPLDLIPSDACDMKSIQTRGGKKYFITFIDDCTKYCYVYLLRSMDEAIEAFMQYKNEVENQLNKKIKVLRSERGGEYESSFGEFCLQHGIVHQTTVLYSPQQNGVAERKNRNLKRNEMMNAMLISFGLSQNLWGEAILFANYILKKLPKKKTNKTPYELWKGKKPSYQFLKVWGCLAKVVVPIPKRIKIGLKLVDCVFVGYAYNSSAYRSLIHKSDVPSMNVNTIIESRNAVFFEEIFPYKSTQVSSSLKRNFESTSSTSHDQELMKEMNEVEPRCRKRAKTSQLFGPNFLTYMLEDEPQSFKEAISTSEAPFWKEAINSEIESILQNHTWELVDLSPSCEPLGYKWIFKRKLKEDGSIDKYRARLVVKGYKQRKVWIILTYIHMLQE